MDAHAQGPELNYVGVWPTLSCPRQCPECLNTSAGLLARRPIKCAAAWVDALNRLQVDIPLTFNGGEPLAHPGFFAIVNGIDRRFAVDLLTTLPGDPQRFIDSVTPARFRRDLPYPAIRVTFHPLVMDLQDTIGKVRKLADAGFDIGMNLVDDPADPAGVTEMKRVIEAAELRCTVKPFLGPRGGSIYGQYRYEHAADGQPLGAVQCRPSVLLIDPQGDIYRCHGDLFGAVPDGRLANLMEDRALPELCYTDCANFGACHPCDVQIKYDRWGKWGYSAVEIKGDVAVQVQEMGAPDWR